MAQEIPEQIFHGPVAQKALIQRGNTVLVSLDKKQEKWDLPGGRIHIGEIPKEALAREVKEELGVDVAIGEPFYTGFLGNRFLVVYRADLKNPEDIFSLAPDEIAEVRWIGKIEINTIPLWPAIKEVMEKYFAH